MNRINIPNSSYADCPIRMILSRISDKWSILTLFTLTQAPVMRFNELQKTIPDISQKMLTVTLRTLEEDGLVKRQIYAQVPPKVEYSLTKRAMSLLPHINSLISWAQENMEDIINDRKKEVCQNAHLLFYAQSPDFHKLGLCYYLKNLYL